MHKQLVAIWKFKYKHPYPHRNSCAHRHTHFHMSSPTRALAHSWIFVSKGVPFQSGSRQSLNLSSFFPSKSRVDVTSGFFQSGNLFKVVSLHHLDSWSASEREWVCVSEWVFEERVREKESILTIHRLTFLPSFHLFFSFFQFASKVFFATKMTFHFLSFFLESCENELSLRDISFGFKPYFASSEQKQKSIFAQWSL